MALGYTLPFGLRDLKLRAISSAGVVSGTSIDLPIARTLSFTESEDFEELRGDDVRQASHGSGANVAWDLEAGGISLDAYAVFAGGTVTTSGITPNQRKSYRKLSTDSRPYFQIEGQAISDNGGDFHMVLSKLKATGDITGEMTDGSFLLTGASGDGFPGVSGEAYDFIQNETVTAIV